MTLFKFDSCELLSMIGFNKFKQFTSQGKYILIFWAFRFKITAMNIIVPYFSSANLYIVNKYNLCLNCFFFTS